MNRSSRIKKLVKKRANGMCECCDKHVTLIDKNGNPFIIPHHIEKLSDGGQDSLYNVAGVCSRCHDNIHYGKNGNKINATLKKKIAEKQKKIDERIYIENEKRKSLLSSYRREKDIEDKRTELEEFKKRRRKELDEQMKNGMKKRQSHRPFR